MRNTNTPQWSRWLSLLFVVVMLTAHVASADTATRQQVRLVQQTLQQLGYNPGPADGLLGTRTREAIQA